MDRRGVSTVGLLAAGIAVALGILGTPNTPIVAVPWWAVLASIFPGVFAGLAFSAHRHGMANSLLTGSVVFVSALTLIGAGAILVSAPIVEPWWYGFGIVGVGFVLLVFAAAEIRELPLVTVAGTARSLSFAVLLILVGFLVAGILLSVPTLLSLELSAVTYSAIEQIALGGGFIIAVVAFVLATDRGLAYLDIRRPDRNDILTTIVGIVAVLVTALAIGVLFWLLGIEGAEHEMADRARTDGVAVLVIGIPLTLLGTAVGEEFLYRNGVQKYLAERFAPATAIVITSFFFAVAHLPALTAAAPLDLMASIALIFALALILGLAYERTRNVIVPIVIHGVYNVAVFLLWYFQLTA